MMQAPWLSVILQGSFDEIYVIDSNTLRLVYANETACANAQYRLEELLGMTLHDLANHDPAAELEHMLRALAARDVARSALETVLVRKDGSPYPIAFRFFCCPSEPSGAIIAIGSTAQNGENGEALVQSKSRFNAIVSNTPGLVYQFVRRPDGSVSFPYLSEACQALLGLSREQLRADPELLPGLIIPNDRASYAESMAASALALKSWNWEGRIWIDEWNDIKWINLRATPRITENGDVQWDGIMTNITQSKLEEMEVKHSRTRLAELSAHIEQVKEQERTRISREIHDDLGGNLTAIKMALALLVNRLPQGNADLAEKAAYVDLLVDRTIEAAHRIASDLRPGILDCGIVAALEWQAREFETHLGIRCRFMSNAAEIKLHSDQATAIFRIAQEALTNIAKHANASEVRIQLVRTKSSLQLKIADNGKGIDAADRLKPHSFGIRGMIERANSLGGKLTIGPAPNGGNKIVVKIPLSSSRQSGGKSHSRTPATSTSTSLLPSA